MSRSGRGYAADSRVRPHEALPDPATPGTCSVCHLPLGNKNRLHLDRPPAAVTEHQAVEHRKLGESD